MEMLPFKNGSADDDDEHCYMGVRVWRVKGNNGKRYLVSMYIYSFLIFTVMSTVGENVMAGNWKL